MRGLLGGPRGGVVSLAFAITVVLGLSGSAFGDFTFGEPVRSSFVHNGEWLGCFSSDGLEVYIAISGQVGYDLCVLKRASTDDDWAPPENLGPAVNSQSAEFSPSISADGLTLYFCSDRPYSDDSRYNILMTTRATKNDPWGQAVNVGQAINGTGGTSWYPCISANGLELYFASWRAGDTDIYVARRATTNDPWSDAMNLGAVVNWPYSDEFPSLSPDGLLLLFADSHVTTMPRPGGYGGSDIWMTRRASLSDPWQSPVNLGPKVNGPGAEWAPRLSGDGRTLYFMTTRWGGWPTLQSTVTPNLDLNGDGKVDQADIAVLLEHSGRDYSLCDIAPSAFGNGVVDWQDLMVLMQHIDAGGSALPAGPILSPNLSPHAFAVDVPRNVILSWTSPEFAPTHDVYFGISLEDVSHADRANPLGVLVSTGQTATTYDPEGLLQYGQTYYWRVDEIIAPLDSRICRGRVLQFTTEPFSYPIAKITATASSSSLSTTGPMKTVDGSGLDPNDAHGTGVMTMWISKKDQSPAWIQYEFDKVYTLDQMWVWNGNQQSEPSTGTGAKDVKVEYSMDGTTWATLAGVPQFAQATGQSDYVHNTTVEFKGAQAKFVRLTMTSNWGGKTVQYSLGEVRFLYIPERAY